ncbi:hypothetical protein NLG97_g3002 [Lecanicillium saksenae]|uniref:Uncharacterized protein n=1 Tax=Lecanicillium saksenae TaxID=468837 RepID=A0ACC1QZI7_9HYPO|nr:hypothetical protein NLG97_g3002 [Lecanicillium saksenae]
MTALVSSKSYAIGWIAALPIERAAAEAQLDARHEAPADFQQHLSDTNSYTWGRIDKHNIVITSLPAGVHGTMAAATTTFNLYMSLPTIKIALLVGIGGGIPRHLDQDVRLGDVVVSQSKGPTGGVIQYDMGKAKLNTLNQTPQVLLYALAALKAEHEMTTPKLPDILEQMWTNYPRMKESRTNKPCYIHQGVENDRLFSPTYYHVNGHTCDECDPSKEIKRDKRDTTDPKIHYGIIASVNTLVKDSRTRDAIAESAGSDCLCIEMEAAGLRDYFPCLIIKGICDYADSHRNNRWHRYASATAAATELNVIGDSVDDESDIESVFSTVSLPSSVSSFADLVSIAVPEWVRLLLDDEVMKELFPIALSKVGPQRFSRNFARFLKNYSQNLKAEVSSEIQRQAPHFVHQSADRTATEITRVLLSTQNAPTPWSQVKNIEKAEQIDHWLASQRAIGKNAEVSKEGADIGTSTEMDDSDEPQLQNLNEVKEFMVSAAAFTNLRLEFRSWLKLDQIEVEEEEKSNEQSEAIEASDQAGEILNKDHSENESDNEQSGEESTDSIRATINQLSFLPADGTTMISESSYSTKLHTSIEVTAKEEKWTFGWWERLKAAFSPPKPGYKRIFYSCSCGDITYFDARETLPGGIDAIRRKLRASTFRVAAGQGASSATAPRRPPPAHTRSGNPVELRAPLKIPAAVRRASSPAPREGETSSAHVPLDQNQELQFLLLCINVKEIAVLSQLEVGSISCDEYLFREIRNACEKITEDHAWKPYMLLPEWLRKAVSDARFVSRICQIVSTIRLHRISSGDFVRFQLVPIRNRIHPTWFTPELPPETEIFARRYLYEPVPLGADIDNIPLAHLLQPGEHYDGFWLSTFPKKLREELHRPAGTRQPIIGWGIRINQTLNWTIALSVLLFMLILISIVVIVYSVVAGDNSAAFGLGAYLAALLTVWLTYHYFSWKEAL